ncbi:MAG: AAA family ATPase [Nitrosopumilus sp.]|nr:MAG: AAA family ATPase [Nitrosopumilus sp.]
MNSAHIMSSERSYKDEVLEKLSLIMDEPEEKELMFNFHQYSEQLVKLLLDPHTHTPFVIGIHGEWGSGKTILITYTQKMLEEKIKKDNSKKDWNVIHFDAWEYERMDIVSALFNKIASQYRTKGKKLKNIAKSMTTIFTDIALRATVGLSYKDLQEHLDNLQKEIPTIKNELEKVIGDNRLIIFVDDLDRCLVDNVLNMLEAIKMFLSAKNVIFIIAVDMTKIERAWQLRYNSETALIEGREHAEKIFQLKLSLPPKTDEDIKYYISNLAKSLANVDVEFLMKLVPHNPRKIKRMLNLIYFILIGLDIPGNTIKIKNDQFEKYFPIVLTWVSITMNHSHLAEIIKLNPSYLIQMSLLCNEYEFLDKMKKNENNISRMKEGITSLKPKKIGIKNLDISLDTLEGLEYIIKVDNAAFKVLKNFAKYLNIQFENNTNASEQLKVFYADHYEPIKDVITKSGLIGI